MTQFQFKDKGIHRSKVLLESGAAVGVGAIGRACPNPPVPRRTRAVATSQGRVLADAGVVGRTFSVLTTVLSQPLIGSLDEFQSSSLVYSPPTDACARPPTRRRVVLCCRVSAFTYWNIGIRRIFRFSLLCLY